MGILNVTPDSFYDGGRFDSPEKAVRRARQMEAEGAVIIDVGGESSRPAGVYGEGSAPVGEAEEIRRVLPVIEAIRRETDVCISVDTYRASVARAALDAGADMVNDITALRQDAAMVELMASTEAPVVLMHMQGRPKDMQSNPVYRDCVGEIREFFVERLKFCREHGVDEARVILDPGIGFGKTLSHNLEIIRHVDRFRSLGRPVMVGASRKSFLAALSEAMSDPEQRLGGSIAAAVLAALGGADLLRAHDVAATVNALKLVQMVREQE
jgi:dihydropteroate synthase